MIALHFLISPLAIDEWLPETIGKGIKNLSHSGTPGVSYPDKFPLYCSPKNCGLNNYIFGTDLGVP
jgi:hypothetical protein